MHIERAVEKPGVTYVVDPVWTGQRITANLRKNCALGRVGRPILKHVSNSELPPATSSRSHRRSRKKTRRLISRPRCSARSAGARAPKRHPRIGERLTLKPYMWLNISG